MFCEMLQGGNLHGISALQDGEETSGTIVVGGGCMSERTADILLKPVLAGDRLLSRSS